MELDRRAGGPRATRRPPTAPAAAARTRVPEEVRLCRPIWWIATCRAFAPALAAGGGAIANICIAARRRRGELLPQPKPRHISQPQAAAESRAARDATAQPPARQPKTTKTPRDRATATNTATHNAPGPRRHAAGRAPRRETAQQRPAREKRATQRAANRNRAARDGGRGPGLDGPTHPGAARHCHRS